MDKSLEQQMLDEEQRRLACPTPQMDQVEECLNEITRAPQLPSFARTRNVKEQFQHAFELIGGIPRLAYWAHTNPDKFYNLYGRLIPQSVNQKTDGTLRVELSWVNGRDTSGRSNAQIIDLPVQPRPPQTGTGD